MPSFTRYALQFLLFAALCILAVPSVLVLGVWVYGIVILGATGPYIERELQGPIFLFLAGMIALCLLLWGALKKLP